MSEDQTCKHSADMWLHFTNISSKSSYFNVHLYRMRKLNAAVGGASNWTNKGEPLCLFPVPVQYFELKQINNNKIKNK